MGQDDGIDKMIQKLQEVTTFLEAQKSKQPVADGYLDGLPLERVQKLGESAHRHLLHIEDHGSLTQADSIKIRRALYGDGVQATANQFGVANSGALFFRDVPNGKKLAPSDPIKLTDTGVKIAKAYRKLHSL